MGGAQHRCPRCGSTDVVVEKTWQLVAPIPDSKGNITITVMGVMKCNACGHRWRGVVTKLKVGSSLAIGDKELGGEEPRKGTEIVLDIDEILKEGEE
ncbi:MAG: chromatin protein Cren7 [Desulfurococcaceae archaeon]